MSITFTGFAGVKLNADRAGSPDDPPVLLIHPPGRSRKMWTAAARQLAEAGRYVVNLSLRGHDDSEWPKDQRYGFDAHVEDIRAVLGQLPARPAIVARGLSAWIALAALEDDGANLATGLALADPPEALSVQAGEAAMAQAIERAEEADACDSALRDVFDVAGAAARMAAASEPPPLPVLIVVSASVTNGEEARLPAAASYPPFAEIAVITDHGRFADVERADEFSGVLVDFLERDVPRAPPEFRSGADARTLRDALGCFATGVTVVTAMSEDGEPAGLTVNSFTSVSLDPPLLLVCISETAGSFDLLKRTSHFAVNVLHIGQQPTSHRFATSEEDRFAGAPWEQGASGAPILTNALATFECARHACHTGGDHIILVGAVERARFEPQRDPLLYFRGKYRRLHFT